MRIRDCATKSSSKADRSPAAIRSSWSLLGSAAVVTVPSDGSGIRYPGGPWPGAEGSSELIAQSCHSLNGYSFFTVQVSEEKGGGQGPIRDVEIGPWPQPCEARMSLRGHHHGFDHVHGGVGGCDSAADQTGIVELEVVAFTGDLSPSNLRRSRARRRSRRETAFPG